MECDPPSSAIGSSNPRNRYLVALLDEFEKSSTRTNNEFERLQKEYQVYKRAVVNAQNELKELKADRDLRAEKIAALEKDVAAQKMLHLQLREETSNEFRCVARKNGTRDQDVNMLKLQSRTDAQKKSFDLENLKYELNTLGSVTSRSLVNDMNEDMTSDTGTDLNRENLFP